MRKYFVSYSFVKDGNIGYGNLDSIVSQKIDGMNIIKKIGEQIEAELNLEANSVVILNFIEF